MLSSRIEGSSFIGAFVGPIAAGQAQSATGCCRWEQIMATLHLGMLFVACGMPFVRYWIMMPARCDDSNVTFELPTILPCAQEESAFGSARICQRLDFHNLIFSIKANNPVIVVQSSWYRPIDRLPVAEVYVTGWGNPLHLGITEALGR